MLKEIKNTKLPQRMRKIVCDNCGKVHFAPRFSVVNYERIERDVEVECCGWRMYGKGYSKELRTCQVYTH